MKIALRKPLLTVQAVLLALVPIVTAAALSVFTFNDGLVNAVSGFMALLAGGLVFCQVCATDTLEPRCIGWLVATQTFSVLAISQWHEARLEVFEHALGVENLNDALLLFLLPPALLVGLRTRGGFALWATRIVTVGICAQVASTGMDMLDDLSKDSELNRFRTSDLAVDASEMVFLGLYLIGLAIYTLGEMKPPRLG